MKQTIFALLGPILDWTRRLLPAAALFAMLFVPDGGLRWIGLFGVVPLVLAFVPGCASCGMHRSAEPGFRPWPCY